MNCVQVLIWVCSGVVNEVRAFANPADADKLEEKWCKEAGIPFDREERERYYDENEVDDDILRWEITVQ